MNKRRKLVIALGAGALAKPFGVFAQQPEKPRRIGVLMALAELDPEGQLRLAAFSERLATLGWVEGRNLSLDVRWTAGDVARASAYAKELVALHPDAILTNTSPVTSAIQRETRTIPIVFTAVSDPVGNGFVKTFARPGGNITGFINQESSLSEKWLQMLKEIAPRVKRVAVMFNPDTAPYAEYYLRPLKATGPKLGVETYLATVRSESDIRTAIAALGRSPTWARPCATTARRRRRGRCSPTRSGSRTPSAASRSRRWPAPSCASPAVARARTLTAARRR